MAMIQQGAENIL